MSKRGSSLGQLYDPPHNDIILLSQVPAEVWLTGLVSLGVEVVRMGVKDLFTAWEEHSYQQEHIIIDIYCVYHYILL